MKHEVKFVWSPEAKDLKQVTNGLTAVCLIFGDGSSVKMSKRKYKHLADAMYTKASKMIGQKVFYRTSQNTANWAPSQWFSDVKPV